MIRLKYYSDPNHGEKLPVESYLLEAAGLQDDRILQYSFLRVPKSEKRGVRWTLLWLSNFPGLSAKDLDFMSPVFSLGFIVSVGGEEKKTKQKNIESAKQMASKTFLFFRILYIYFSCIFTHLRSNVHINSLILNLQFDGL